MLAMLKIIPWNGGDVVVEEIKLSQGLSYVLEVRWGLYTAPSDMQSCQIVKILQGIRV